MSSPTSPANKNFFGNDGFRDGFNDQDASRIDPAVFFPLRLDLFIKLPHCFGSGATRHVKGHLFQCWKSVPAWLSARTGPITSWHPNPIKNYMCSTAQNHPSDNSILFGTSFAGAPEHVQAGRYSSPSNCSWRGGHRIWADLLTLLCLLPLVAHIFLPELPISESCHWLTHCVFCEVRYKISLVFWQPNLVFWQYSHSYPH